jgi:stringent starvation protein B
VTPPPGKLETLLGYLDLGIAMVHLDARRPGVVVPPEYAEEPHLRLNLSRRFNIPDLEITERGVQATLSFRGRHFQCQLPWSAVFGITSQLSGDGQVWPEDLPGEVAHQLSSKAAARQETPAARRRLEPVADGDGEDESEGPPEVGERADGERRQDRRPLLRHGPLASVENGDAPPAHDRRERERREPEPAPHERHNDEPPEGGTPSGTPRRGHLRLVR